MKLSVVIITRNEETNIGRCLDSVRFADEWIVIDSQSTDSTCEIAREKGARVYECEWHGYGPAKREGVARAEGNWIIALDADEVVSVPLAEQIKEVIAREDGPAGYRFPRKTFFLSRWILHCGWYPDYQLRLFRRGQGNFTNDVVHEFVEVDGAVGLLTGELLHYSDPDLEHYLKKFNRYTTIGAEDAYASGRRASASDIVVRPVVSFFKHYVTKQGFRDGMEGFILSALSSMAVLVKYSKLRHLAYQRRQEGKA
jgi:glycosyltransferase involved in cell wall biosynthesis